MTDENEHIYNNDLEDEDNNYGEETPFGGLPTAPDVAKLDAAFGVPTEGHTIPWLLIEKAIHYDKYENRFETVVKAWRRQLLREHNVFMCAIRGIGLQAATPAQRVIIGTDNVTFGVRKVGRAQKLVSSTDWHRLSPEDAKAARHLVMRAASIKGAAHTAPKVIDYPEPVVKKPEARESRGSIWSGVRASVQ